MAVAASMLVPRVDESVRRRAGEALGVALAVALGVSGVAMLLTSTVMLRSSIFGPVTGWAGVIAGVTGLVPASFGTLGFILSFISLLPLLIWLASIGRRFLQLQLQLAAAPSR